MEADTSDVAPPARRDLAAMIVPLGRALTAAELPTLREHNLTMWAYIVLTALADKPIRSQLQLANEIGADKTRIIPVLDDLQARGLLNRRPDPSDRRVRLLTLTSEGERLCRTAQREIQRREELLLARLDTDDRDGFLRAIQFLSALPDEEIVGGHESQTAR